MRTYKYDQYRGFAGSLWNNKRLYDFLDHMLYLKEQEDCPFYIPICCNLEEYIARQPYDYQGVRQWMIHHMNLAERIWKTRLILEDDRRLSS